MKTKSLQAIRVCLVLFALTFYAGAVKAQQASKSKPDQTASKKAENMKTIKVEVKGMSCQEGCANGLDATFKKVPGIIRSKTTFDNSVSEIIIDESKISEKEITEIIEKKGFKARVLSNG